MAMPKNIVASIALGSLLWSPVYTIAATTHSTPNKISVNVEEILDSSSGLRGEITRGLDDPKVQAELSKMGVSKEEVKLRLAAMTDEELQQVKNGAERQAGGDVVVISVTTLLIAIIILILILR